MWLIRTDWTPSIGLSSFILTLNLLASACSPFGGHGPFDDDDIEPSEFSLTSCARPEMGCSCEPGTASIPCYDLVNADGEQSCGVGTRYCRDGAWTTCESITAVKVRGRAQRLAPGFTSCDLADLGVAACNPDCFVAEDEPTPCDVNGDNSEPTIFRSTDNCAAAAPGIYLDGSGGPSSGGGAELVDSDGDGIVDVAEEPGCENAPGNIDSSGVFGCPGGDNIGVYALLNPKEYATRELPPFQPPPPPIDLYILADHAIVEIDNWFWIFGLGPRTIRIAMDEPLKNIRDNISTFSQNIEAPYVSRGFAPDVRYGFGYFHDYQAWPHFGDSRGNALAYRHLQNFNADANVLRATLNSLNPADHERRGMGNWEDWFDDWSWIPFSLVFYGPESGSQALWSIATGQGLPFGTHPVSAAPACPAGSWGYPCFRDGALPVVAVLMDDPMHNGPGHGSLTGALPYPLDLPSLRGRPTPTSSGSVTSLGGAGSWSNPYVLPGDAGSYWRRYTGSTKHSGNSVGTGPCETQDMFYLVNERRNWNGNDQTLEFTVNETSHITVHARRTDGNEMRVALYRKGQSSHIRCAAGTNIDFTQDLAPGTYLVRLDGSRDDSGGLFGWGKHHHVYDYELNIGKFDWRIGYNSHVNPELNDNGIKVVGLYGCSVGAIFAGAQCKSTCPSGSDECTSDNTGVNQLIELAYDTNARRSNGAPIYSVVNTGAGAANALSSGIADLITDFEQEIVLIPRDNPSTPFDERRFIAGITAEGCHLGGPCQPTVGQAFSCTRCRTSDPIDATIAVYYDPSEGHPPQTTEPQIFDFTVDVVSRRVVAGRSGESVLRSIPVRIVIPPDIRLEAGAYWRDYDATLFDPTLPDDTPLCAIGGETGLRPDWLTFNWSAITPANSSGSSYIQFDVQSDDSKLGLGGAPGFCFRVPNLPGVPTGGCSVPRQPNSGAVAIAENLIDQGGSNFKHHLRVTATLHPTPDGAVGPTLYDMGVRYACTPFE